MILPKFSRLSMRTQFVFLLCAFLAISFGALAMIGKSLVTSQVRNEARSVADMVENIGKWASQYGGLWVKTTADASGKVGTFLEKKAFPNEAATEAASAAKEALAQSMDLGSKARAEQDLARAMDLVNKADVFHSKNPALIQREVSDITAASSSNAKFRMTAETVLNPNNAPDGFEKMAIQHIKSTQDQEFSIVDGEQLRYARKLVAVKSCLRCHGEAKQAPSFILEKFNNHGGGFGYKENEVAGIISVTIPMPAARETLIASMSTQSWFAVGGVFAMATLLFSFVVRRIIRPVNNLRAIAERMSQSGLSDGQATMLNTSNTRNLVGSSNEVHRLAVALGELGESLQILYRQLKKAKSRIKE